MDFSVRLITPEETYFLRQMNLRPQLKVEECALAGDKDQASFHLGLSVQDKILSIVSFMVEPLKDMPSKHPYRLRGMSTHKEFQGHGFGYKLVEAAVKELELRGSDLVWCQARTTAIPFYERLGFSIIGEEYLTAQGPHKTMYKRLNPS